jgi:hypothetical protein
MKKSSAFWMALLVSGWLAACDSGSSAAAIPSQQWHGLEVRIEPRPNPPAAGMNEFLVMVTDKRGRPGYNLVVSLRASDQDEWKQAIEDGQVGVYRRSVRLEQVQAPVLQVQLRQGADEEVLYFKLPVAPA